MSLAVFEVVEQDQLVSYGLGFLRPFNGVSSRDLRLVEALNAEALDGIDDLSSYELLAIALSASKMYDFQKAEAALESASRDAGESIQYAVARAQILRNRGEILSAIAALEDVIVGPNSMQDAMAARALVETLEDLLTLMKVEQPGLGAGLRELLVRFETMQSRIAGGEVSGFLSDIKAMVDVLKSQLETAEEMARHSVEMLAESRERTSRLESHLTEMRNELSGERAAATELGNENARLNNTLNEIYLSKAWRMVSRVRAVLKVPSRVFGRGDRGTDGGTTVPTVAPGISPGLRAWHPPVESYPYLVSVIMPVFNKGSTLRSSIDSVKAQTLSSVEIVIWDDGSTDPETLRVLEEVRGLPDVTLFGADNQGVAGARNSAISLSRGRYVCCLDPDDQVAPTYLEMAVALLESQPEFSIAYPWVHSVGDADELWETQDLEASLITRANHVPVCAVFRRDVFLETGGFSQEMTNGYEDWEFWVHAAELGFRGKSIPAHLFKYRFSTDAGQSRDARARDSHQDLIDQIAALHPRLAKSGVPYERPVATKVRHVGAELGQRQFPAGAERPVVLTVPWFTVGGADQVVETLVRNWVADGRTVIVFMTTPLAVGMANRRHSLEQITPYVYCLLDFLPPAQWYEFFAAAVASLDKPVLFNVGSAWLYANVKALRRDFPDLRIVDQQFNTLAHLESNQEVSGVLDLTIAAYHELAEQIEADGRISKVAPIYVGIENPADPLPKDVDSFRGLALVHEGERLVLFVGRLADEKRPEWVIKMAAELAGDGVRTVIIGDGPLRHEVEEAAKRNSRLSWIPEIDFVEPALAAADVLVLPSKTEGIPLVAMESLALGTPLVATRVGGLPDLENEVGATLTDPNDLDAFIEAVRATLAEGGGRARLSKTFSAEEMVESYDGLLFESK
jgi:glycosyltransferase involved in cell wall biosynthesis